MLPLTVALQGFQFEMNLSTAEQNAKGRRRLDASSQVCASFAIQAPRKCQSSMFMNHCKDHLLVIGDLD